MDFDNAVSLEWSSKRTFEQVMATQIYQQVVDSLQDDGASQISVEVTFQNQKVVDTNTSPLPTLRPSSGPSSGENRQRSMVGHENSGVEQDDPSISASLHQKQSGYLSSSGRSLQQGGSILEITFDTAIMCRTSVRNHSAEKYVGEAFNTSSDQLLFLSELKASGDLAFFAIKEMKLSIDGRMVAGTRINSPPDDQNEDQNTIEASNSEGLDMVLVIGSVAAGVSFIALAGLIAYIFRDSTVARDDEAELIAPRPMSFPHHMTDVGSQLRLSNQMDVSTLGDPLPYEEDHDSLSSLERDDSLGFAYDFKHIAASEDSPRATASLHKGKWGEISVESESEPSMSAGVGGTVSLATGVWTDSSPETKSEAGNISVLDAPSEEKRIHGNPNPRTLSNEETPDSGSSVLYCMDPNMMELESTEIAVNEESSHAASDVFEGIEGISMSDIARAKGGDDSVQSLFSFDESTFNERYGIQMNGEHIEVHAPSGALGMVLDTGDHGMPRIHTVKESSVLRGQIKVGDRLLSVDGDDTSLLSASIASRLISTRHKSSRLLVFSRQGASTRVPVDEDAVSVQSSMASINSSSLYNSSSAYTDDDESIQESLSESSEYFNRLGKRRD